MNYIRTAGLLALALLFVMAARWEKALRADSSAQAKGCPTVKATGPDEVISGNPVTITVNVTGGDKDVSPTYNWTVSAGAISSGQGTSTITVDTKEVPVDSSITATVELGGYDRECSVVSSVTTSVVAKKPPSR